MGSKMKKLFKRSKYDLANRIDGMEESSLENILREKDEENKKIEAEEKEFQRQRRNRERKLILIEEEELLKRETERDQKRADLKLMKHNNKLINEKVDEQIEALYRKRDEIIKEQEDKEIDAENKISIMETELNDLRQSLAHRVKLYGDEDPAFYSDVEFRGSRDSSLESTFSRSARSPSAPHYSSDSFQRLPVPESALYASVNKTYDPFKFEVEKTRDNVLEAEDDNIYEDGVDESNYPTITGFNIFPALFFSIMGIFVLNSMLKTVFSLAMFLLMIYITIYSIKNFL